MNHLYIIKTKKDGSFKIGRSDDPSFRLKQLQTGNPYNLKLILIIENCGHMERELHERLSKYRLKGEWFTEEGLAELPSWIYEKISESEI